MTAEIKLEDNILKIDLNGEIDHHNISDARKKIDIFIMLNKPKIVYLDFSNIKFMDSSGIGLIMGRYREISSYSGILKITGCSLLIKKLLLIANLDKFVTIE